MMKSKQTNNQEENPFSLSIGDLMAALLLLFILLLVVSFAQIKKEENKRNGIAQVYKDTKEKIVIGLKSEFGNDLESWDASFDTINLSISFQAKEQDISFQASENVWYNPGDNKPTVHAEKILKDFLPRYLTVLQEFEPEIEEIRIEGHTDNTPFKGYELGAINYLKNLKLSQDRAWYILNLFMTDTTYHCQEHRWVEKYVTANGLSYSRPVVNNGDTIWDKSRRVEFRVVTKADEKMDSLVKILK